VLSSLLLAIIGGVCSGFYCCTQTQAITCVELARLTGTSAGTLHKELTKLTSGGVLRRQAVGNQVRYSADRDCPVFEELASILRKTSGLVDVLVEALSSVEKNISLAFVFGSVARGEQQSNSDVDVMLVGSLGFADAVQVLHPVQATLQREINPVVYSLDEFRRRAAMMIRLLEKCYPSPSCL